MPDLLLCGGTGDLGGRIALRLADRGVAFRALVRQGSDGTALAALGAQPVPGDLTAPDGLARALTGVRTVVTTANAVARMLAGDRSVSIDAVDRDGNAALVRAAEQAGVERFVFVSTAGLTDLLVRLSPFVAAKRDTERLLSASGMRSVVVRPASFQEIWLTGVTGLDPDTRRAAIFGRGRAPVTFVSEDDVAEACVRLALAADPPAVVEFGGPQAMSRREAVAAYEQAAGARFRRLPVPRPVLAAGSRGLRPVRPAVAAIMGLALATDIEGCTPSDEPLRVLGIEPRSASEFIAGRVRQRSPG